MKTSIILHVDTSDKDIYKNAQLELEKQLLRAVLDDTRGNQCEATRRLGLSRGSVRTKLARVYGGTGSDLKSRVWLDKKNRDDKPF